ncbi:MAG: DsbA family protein [Acidimicrobiales bacterium]
MSFSVTWDYRCPFARNVHEHILDGLEGGAPWDVRFVPFFLDQAHAADGDPPVWEDSVHRQALLALSAGVVVRDRFPEHFLRAHRALFEARHDRSADLRDPQVIGAALERAGVDQLAVLAEVERGASAEVVRREHEQIASELGVFGVPTFILGDDAAFVRLMTRPLGDTAVARTTVDRILELIGGQPELNELKHTRITR